MREIVKVLLQEGIDEETIHEVLDVIEGFNLNKVVGRSYDAGKISPGKYINLRKKSEVIPGTNDLHYDEKGEVKGEGSSKERSKNERGQSQTDIRAAIEKNRSLDQIQMRREQDNKSGNKVAIKKSIDRHSKKNK